LSHLGLLEEDGVVLLKMVLRDIVGDGAPDAATICPVSISQVVTP
jgi:hypothetical protein